MFSTRGRSIGKAKRAYSRTQEKSEARDKPSERIVFSALLIIIGLSAVPFTSIEPWCEGIFEGAIFMLGACCLVTGTTNKHWHVPDLLAPLIGLIVFACFQTLPIWPNLGAPQTITIDPFRTKRFIVELLALTLMLAMLLRYVTTRSQLLTLAHIVIIVGAASAAFAMLHLALPGAPFASMAKSTLSDEGFGQFKNRNHFALLMEMSFGVALGLALYGGHGLRRHLYIALACLCCVALIMTKSRGGIISMLGQVTFIVWMAFSHPVNQPAKRSASDQPSVAQSVWQKGRLLALRCVLIVILVGAALATVLLLGGEPVRHRLETVPGEFVAKRAEAEHRSARRLEIWGATLRLIKAEPWVGSGFGAYKTAITEYFQPVNDWQPQQAHNEYLELAAAGGVVGTLLATWFVFNLIRDVRNCLQKTDAFRRAVCVGALVGLVGVAIHSLVDFGLHVIANALVCCALIALATAKTQPPQVASRSTVI